jgi:hypothetical protein
MSLTRYLNYGSFSVTDEPQRLVTNTGHLQGGRRSWLHMTNTGSKVVYLVDESATDNTDGYPIPPQDLTTGILGEKELQEHSGEVYVCCANGETSTLKWMEQRD